MLNHFARGRVSGRGLILAAALAASTAVVSSANAGECPADQRKPNAREASTLPGKDVTDTVLAAIDLANEPIKADGRQMRVRKLVVQPGGIVPWHSHDNRPAMIYIVSGEVLEYASNCAAPIAHKAGDVASEKAGISHWWQNAGNAPVVLISVDLFPVANMKDQHMM